MAASYQLREKAAKDGGFVWLHKQVNRSNVHLLWQRERTGPPHAGLGTSFEFKVKF